MEKKHVFIGRLEGLVCVGSMVLDVRLEQLNHNINPLVTIALSFYSSIYLCNTRINVEDPDYKFEFTL